MSSCYEALSIYKAAMDVAVLVDAVVQRLAKGQQAHPCREAAGDSI
jgi:hypothetical protein